MKGVKPMVFRSEGVGGFVLLIVSLLKNEELPHSLPHEWVAAVRRVVNRRSKGTGTTRGPPTHSRHNTGLQT